MKKTLTVNISGIAFNIDEDAYMKLSRYLERLRRHFEKDTGRDEILAGIEERLADMFQESKKFERQVVTLQDVESAISQLGEPSQMSGDNTESPEDNDYEAVPKRLFRDPENKYIGGVCGGLGAYFHIDSTWVRLIFLLTLFLGGSGLLIYVILWIVIPKAVTTADRLSMRGEKINLNNIEKSIKEDLRDIKQNLEDISKNI